MSLFELETVRKAFDKRVVLDIAHLTLEKNKIYAIVGPNGAGKTTLLRMLNMLETPDAGSILYMGKRIEAGRRLELARQMCMVFQRPVMFRRSVYQNVGYGLKLRKINGLQKEQRIMEALAFVGMADFAHQPAFRLSGGEMQRVALARALVLHPSVLLLDEPTANLDPASVQAIEQIIVNCKEHMDTSIVMVTHNLFQAKRIADETVLMMDGRIIEKNQTHTFFNQPAHQNTRRFINGTLVY